MSWVYLTFAIAFEVIGTTTLKTLSRVISFTTLAMLASYGLSLLFSALAMKKIDIGVAYAVWSGIGITAIEIIGVLIFHERMDCLKVVFISLILVGTIGLNFAKTS